MSLHISNLQVRVDTKQILNGLDLTIMPGELHAVMGPNGSGKSTLALTLAGHPQYQVQEGSQVKLDTQDILEMSPDERSQAGLFLAFQYPVEIPGVRVKKFLRLAYQARFETTVQDAFGSVLKFNKFLQEKATQLKVDPTFLDRNLNENFSGGEKKRLEILQMAVLQPKYAVLDETDSGLDIDAIKVVAEGVNHIISEDKPGVLVITHYQRILEFLEPDFVHIVIKGKVVATGDASLITQIEEQGYASFSSHV